MVYGSFHVSENLVPEAHSHTTSVCIHNGMMHARLFLMKRLSACVFSSLRTSREFSHIVTASFPGGQRNPYQDFPPVGSVFISEARWLSAEDQIYSPTSSPKPAHRSQLLAPPPLMIQGLLFPVIQQPQEHSTSQMAGQNRFLYPLVQWLSNFSIRIIWKSP